ncbi:MAG TPA: antibiotic biosynthesis monooxygenase [Gaiellaceae bacterium]|nr:antibiotic biosynthesis monooxygenase [Gaiellaceae bacterium]
MTDRFGLHGRFGAHPGKGDELEAILLEAAAALEAHADCLLYVVSRQPRDPDAVWVTEAWTSRDAHFASLQDEAARALIERALPLIAELPERSVELRPVGGKGL